MQRRSSRLKTELMQACQIERIVPDNGLHFGFCFCFRFFVLFFFFFHLPLFLFSVVCFLFFNNLVVSFRVRLKILCKMSSSDFPRSGVFTNKRKTDQDARC